MAAGFSSPPTLPDQSLTIHGEPLLAVTLENIADSFNWSHAEGPCWPLLSQEWADGQCSWANSAGTGAVTGAAVWRIPQVSPAHQTLVVTSLCSQSNNPAEAGTVATFSINGDSGTISPDFGADTYKDLELDFGNPGAGYADLQMDLTSPNGSLTLSDLTARFKRLTSALADGPAGGETGAYVPMGQAAVVADKPLPAQRGRQIIRNAGVLLDYPRSVFCWSALRGIQAWSNAALAEDYARAFPRRSVVLVRPRLRAQGGGYTVWVRAVPDAAEDEIIHLYAAPIAGDEHAGWAGPVSSLVVAADAMQTPVWLSPSNPIPLPDSRMIGSLPWLTAAVGFEPTDGTGLGPVERNLRQMRGFTTAHIIGMSVWGA